MIDLTVDEIRRQLREVDSEQFAVLERSLLADTRKGVIQALEATRARLESEAAEKARLDAMYEFDRSFLKESSESSESGFVVGLDEVGRGPLAGPLAVGAVVFPEDVKPVCGLNDSKQVDESKREAISESIRRAAVACSVLYIEPSEIDTHGMTASLKRAFRLAVEDVERQGIYPSVVLLDGNPLNFDPRERNVVKGDAKSASIAAASMIAKVSRDALMRELDKAYPGYGFADNKGYGTQSHRNAIRELGLSPIHRVSFCSEFTQMSLF